MKKMGILNRQLSKVIASMGHGDYLVIADAGLPIPLDKELVDLAISKNIPNFIEVLNSVLIELEVKSAIIPIEMKNYSFKNYNNIIKTLKDKEVAEISHEDFKKKMISARAFVRTGEFSPYSNIILISDVVF